MNAYIYIEGGGDGSKNLKILCQAGFHKLLDRMSLKGRKPRLVACGGRGAVYDRFDIAHSARIAAYIAMWIDSEEPMVNTEAAWEHLQTVTTVPRWERPEGAEDDQVLFMTTCMETWLVTDRSALKQHFGNKLQDSALPPLTDMEKRSRQDIQECLMHATRDCSNAYAKGSGSFEILGKLSPATLGKHLPSFVRVHRILNAKL